MSSPISPTRPSTSVKPRVRLGLGRKTFRSALLTLFALPLVALAETPAPAAQKPAAPAAVQEDCPHPPPPADAKPAAGWTLTRGEALKGAPAVKLGELLAKPQAHEGK